MSENKHTPGPWVTEESGYKDIGHCIWIGSKKQATQKVDEVVCRIGVDSFFKHQAKERRVANARLIAAAPELLEALEMLLEFPNTGPATTAARAALAKARGDQAMTLNTPIRRGTPDWQPIETAPKDGSEIIVGSIDGGVFAGFWSDTPNHWGDYGWFEESDRAACYATRKPFSPTHWMPLPPPPEQQS